MRRRGRLLVAAAIAFTAATHAAALHGQTMRTLTSSRQLWDEEPLTVEVEYGAGTLEVRPLQDQDLLYRMEMRYDAERVSPVAEFDTARRVLELGSRFHRRGGPDHEKSKAEIELTDRVPLDLGLHFGAGSAEMDLGGLRIQNLQLETGASETTLRIGTPNPIAARRVELKAGAAELNVVGLGNLRAEELVFQGGVGSTTLDFSGAWNRNATAHVQMGMGEVVLRFPRSLGVRIDRSSFLTSFDAEGFQRRDDAYFSDNWNSASHQLTVDVEAAFGAVEIEWID